MIASYNWWKIHTVILRECYHDTMQILLYYGNIMNMFPRKSLKLQCKKTTSKKVEIIRVHSGSLGCSDLRFLINTCKGLSFQWSFFPRQDHTTHWNVKSLILIYIYIYIYIYIWRILIQVYSSFYKYNYAKTDNTSFLCQ